MEKPATLKDRMIHLLSDHKTEEDAIGGLAIARALRTGISSVQTKISSLRAAGYNIVSFDKPARYYLKSGPGSKSESQTNKLFAPDVGYNALRILENIAEKEGVSLEAIIQRQKAKGEAKAAARAKEKIDALEKRIHTILMESKLMKAAVVSLLDGIARDFEDG